VLNIRIISIFWGRKFPKFESRAFSALLNTNFGNFPRFFERIRTSLNFGAGRTEVLSAPFIWLFGICRGIPPDVGRN
jgi:hypothetical protein